jgi:hypothetical protein
MLDLKNLLGSVSGLIVGDKISSLFSSSLKSLKLAISRLSLITAALSLELESSEAT